jgi:hypothetical protein
MGEPKDNTMRLNEIACTDPEWAEDIYELCDKLDLEFPYGVSYALEAISEFVYDGTSSGVRVELTENGIQMFVSAEDTEFEASAELDWPISTHEFAMTAVSLDDEAIEAWVEAHKCPDCWDKPETWWVDDEWCDTCQNMRTIV